MTTPRKQKSNRPASPCRNNAFTQPAALLNTPDMSDEERDIYGRLVCQYCGKSMSAKLMEERRKAQSFPVCEPCLAEIIPMAEKMQAGLADLMGGI